MLIPVIYPNGKYDLVKDFYLTHLINSGKILKFKRSSGWVNITAANLRGEDGRHCYHGPERRWQALANTEAIDTEPSLIEPYRADTPDNDQHA